MTLISKFQTANNIYEASAANRQEFRAGSNMASARPITSGVIVQTFAAFILELDMPDTATGHCEIHLGEGIVTITGSGIVDLELNLARMAGHDFNYSRLQRAILLLASFGNDDLRAECNEGLLYIYIPKRRMH